MSGGRPYQMEADACRTATVHWRAAAGWLVSTVQSVTDRCGDLLLDDALGVIPAYGDETADELRLAADLLDATVDAALLVGFDAASTTLTGEALVLWQRLRGSLNDDTGLHPVDLVDPASLDGRVVAHFGDVPLFGPGGPTAADVNQGSLGDCWLLAALASVADGDPDRITTMITDNGDGTYSVVIDGVVVTVDDEFPVTTSGAPVYATGQHWSEPAALWPLVLEKAVAASVGEGYDGLQRDDVERAFDLLGRPGGMTIDRNLAFDASPAEVLDRIDVALDAGRPVVATSEEDFGMGDVHAWSVVATGLSAAGEPTVTIRNPWGTTGFEVEDGAVRRSHDGEELEGVEPDDVHIDEDAAEMTIPLTAFADEFRELDLLEAWDPA